MNCSEGNKSPSGSRGLGSNMFHCSVDLKKKNKNRANIQKEISISVFFFFLQLETPNNSCRIEETVDDVLYVVAARRKRCKLITETSLKTREWERRKVKVKHFLKLLLPFYLSLPPPYHHHHQYHLHTSHPPLSPTLSPILSLHSLWVKEGKVIVMKWPREARWQPSPDKLFLTGF